MSKKAGYLVLRVDKRVFKIYNEDMKYLELTVHTTTEASELIADVMWDYSAGGVAVSDAADVIKLQNDSTVFWDYIDETLTRNAESDVMVKCYLELDSAENAAKEILREIENRKELSGGEISFGTLEATRRIVESDDWIDVWKKHFRPIPFTKITVVPEWIPYEKKAGEEIVLLDSNMAFGTGEHETTAMCVELLETHVKEGDICIDVGCGSGILGIAAAKLKAGHCYLSDLDPVAVRSSLHNAKKNGVENWVTVTEANLLDDSKIEADVIVANITAEVLRLLAPSVPARLKQDGTLILSGILCDRVDKVESAFAAVGLHVMEKRQRGEWVALVLKKG